jgi:hypothetical protein
LIYLLSSFIFAKTIAKSNKDTNSSWNDNTDKRCYSEAGRTRWSEAKLVRAYGVLIDVIVNVRVAAFSDTLSY